MIAIIFTVMFVPCCKCISFCWLFFFFIFWFVFTIVFLDVWVSRTRYDHPRRLAQNSTPKCEFYVDKVDFVVGVSEFYSEFTMYFPEVDLFVFPFATL